MIITFPIWVIPMVIFLIIEGVWQKVSELVD